MITIHATKKLSAKLPGIANTLDSAGAASRLHDDNPLSGWHANLLILQHRNCVLLVHDATRFPLFIKGQLKADFANFDWLFADALVNTLLKLGANQIQLDTTTSLLEPCHFDIDCNRSVQGTMNIMARDFEHMLWYDNAKIDEVSSYSAAAWLADRPCTVKDQKDCIWPEKAMLELLSQVGGQAPAKQNVIQLKDYLKSSNR